MIVEAPPRAGELQVLRLHPEAKMPIRALPQAAGLDIHAYKLTESGRPAKYVLPPRFTVSVSTGIALRPPPGHCLLCLSRSGLAQRSVFVANAPGLIDPDYTGEILVLLYNGGVEVQWIEHGQRIAQILVAPLCRAVLSEVSHFPSTDRGDKGFGSTGL